MGIQYSMTETQPHTHTLFIHTVSEIKRGKEIKGKSQKKNSYSAFINNEHPGEKEAQTSTTNSSETVAGGKNTHFINKLSKVKSEDLYKQVQLRSETAQRSTAMPDFSLSEALLSGFLF